MDGKQLGIPPWAAPRFPPAANIAMQKQWLCGFVLWAPSGYENGFKLTILPDRLSEPLRRKKPTVYFVNSMSDLFHQSIPDAYIDQVFDVIARSTQHTFQVLTKRAERMASYFRSRAVPRNAWLGVNG